jgi:2'-5' RNA ligase
MQNLEFVLEEAIHRIAPFEIRIRGLGCFPNYNKPRVLWVGVEDQIKALPQIQNVIEDQSAALGIKRESRKFHPHLTIGRVRRGIPSREIDLVSASMQHSEKIDLGVELVSKISLIQSELRPDGAKYSSLFTKEFKGA